MGTKAMSQIHNGDADACVMHSMLGVSAQSSCNVGHLDSQATPKDLWP